MNIEIIAELGQGYEGRPEQARLLMKAAASAGADVAKYQLVYADELATPDYKYYELFKTLEMPDEVWVELDRYSKELNIQLHLDIFGTRSLLLAEKIGVSAIKLHGTDITNIALLGEVAKSNVPRIMLGAGGAHFNELWKALEILMHKQVVIIFGFQGYPTPNEANHIARIKFVNEQLGHSYPNAFIGFADHALPDSPLRYALAATAIGAGAKVLEKHLTLGKVMKLEDYESALNPDEFSEFTKVVRECGQAFSKVYNLEDFGMTEAEKGYRKMIRRHIVTSQNLKRGKTILPTDLILKRTSAENVITDFNLIYQKKLKFDIGKNLPISTKDIE